MQIHGFMLQHEANVANSHSLHSCLAQTAVKAQTCHVVVDTLPPGLDPVMEALRQRCLGGDRKQAGSTPSLFKDSLLRLQLLQAISPELVKALQLLSSKQHIAAQMRHLLQLHGVLG